MMKRDETIIENPPLHMTILAKDGGGINMSIIL